MSSVSSQQAFCLRCRKQTTPINSHTVILQNGSRALQGHCADCQTEVYKILEKKKPIETKTVLSSNAKPEIAMQQAVYPDAYCVKCKTNTPTLKGHTVILANDRRALRGICPNCSSEIYKILPKDADYTKKTKLSSNYSPANNQPFSLAVAKLPDSKSISTKSAIKWQIQLKESAIIGAIVASVIAALWFFRF